MASTSPTQRSLKHLRALGWRCWIVERWNPHTMTRLDLFNAFDILAIAPFGLVGVQTTSQSNVSKHVHKLAENEYMPDWLRAGGIILMHGWAKRGERGKRKLWSVSERYMWHADLEKEKRPESVGAPEAPSQQAETAS